MSAEASAQALSALGESLSVTAHNVANTSTPGYAPFRAVLADGPPDGAGGQGVHVAAVERAGQGLAPASAHAPATPEAPASALGSAGGVDLVREMTDLMVTGRAFEANAVCLRAAEETTGHLLDIIV